MLKGNRLALFGCAMLCVVQLCVGLTACAGGGEDSDDARQPAAYFADQVIYEDEITDYTQDYRNKNGISDDAGWASYLASASMNPESWREDVIRKKADRALVESKAEELGVSVDSSVVDERLAAFRQRIGLADDDEAWAAYLEQRGQTEEGLRDTYSFTYLEQQVLDLEAGLSNEVRAEMCNDYIQTNLADQVVRHYRAFVFGLEDKDAAKACLAKLSPLSDQALAETFSQDAVEAGQIVDLSWDFLYNETTIDPYLKLRKAKLEPGVLYAKLLKGTDAYRVVYCLEKESFGGEISFDRIGSESLKSVISDLTMSSQWAARISQYLSNLEAEANVQVVPMPEGLPYDVVE